MNEVRLVEIEIHSYCNRRCSWCPNKFIDRSKHNIMSHDAYIKILSDLSVINYNGTISYSRYNEPFAEIQLLKDRTALARAILGDVKLVTNTNGDYLSYKALNGLMIDELTIMDYDCIGMMGCADKLRRIGAIIDKYEYPYIYAHFGNMKILYYVNWPLNACIEDRGGSLAEYSDTRRELPCHEPKYFIGIDYNGNVMPCCHMRSDNIDHIGYILGNVTRTSLEEIYESDKARNIRAIVGKEFTVDSRYLLPCKYCMKIGGRYTRQDSGINY